MKKISVLIATVFSILSTVSAQKTSNPVFTADSLATGNYKDVLSSFFQLAFNRFTGPDKEIRFTSNPYAVMAKLDTTLLVDTNYFKYRHLRNLNFSFAARLDTGYKFSGFSSSVKYALINKRDETVSRAFVVSAFNNNKVQELFILNDTLQKYIASLVDQPQLQQKIQTQKTMFFRGQMGFNKLDTLLQNKIKEFAKEHNTVRFLNLINDDPTYSISNDLQKTYDSLKTLFNNKLLWTIGFSDTTYKDQFLFSNLVFSSQLLKGIVNPSARTNVELDLRSYLQYKDDTLAAGRDLKRSIFSFEPGLNLIFNTKGTHKSFAEFRLSGSYQHTFSSLYKGEERNRLILNSTLRIRVLNDIWIPLEINYDPRTGNVFGFLNIRANFIGMMKGN